LLVIVATHSGWILKDLTDILDEIVNYQYNKR